MTVDSALATEDSGVTPQGRTGWEATMHEREALIKAVRRERVGSAARFAAVDALYAWDIAHQDEVA